MAKYPAAVFECLFEAAAGDATKLENRLVGDAVIDGIPVRSAMAADNPQRMGYTNVISMDGGWAAWTEAGVPVE